MKLTFTNMITALLVAFCLLTVSTALTAVPTSPLHQDDGALEVNLLLPSEIVMQDKHPMLAIVENPNGSEKHFDAIFEIADMENNIVFRSILNSKVAPSNDLMLLNFDSWTSKSGDYQASLSLQIEGRIELQEITKDFSIVTNRTMLKPLYELFTSSTCSPCGYANPIIDAVLDANQGSHSVIKYQMNFPGSGDPYYIPENGVRGQYYNVQGVPTLRVNAQSVNPYQFSQSVYDSFLGQPTNMEIEITNAYIDQSMIIAIEADIMVSENYDAGLIVHMAVLEKLTTGNTGNNGEREFHHVAMKMLPNGEGAPLPALTPGNPHNLVFYYDMEQTFMEKPNRLELLIFVQNNQTKEIIQSEMADVDHDFEDFMLTFEVKDSFGNLAPGAFVFVQEHGSNNANEDGLAIYQGVFPGVYEYEISASGLYPTEGTVEVTDDDVLVQIVLEVPEFYFYEDFYLEIPATWTVHATSPDFLYWAGEKVIFFRQSGAMNPILLVAPEIDLSPAEMLYFDAGEVQGAATIILGTVTDPNDPSTFTELASYTPTGTMQTFSFDLTQLDDPDGIRLAWKHQGGLMTYFSFDNVIITVGEAQTYWLLLDANPQDAGIVEGNGLYLPGEEITLNAIANPDWEFLHWTDLEGVFVSDQPEFVYVMPEFDVILIAHFESTVSVAEHGGSRANVFPNPAGDRFTVSANSIIHRLTITDLTGRLIYQQQTNELQVTISTEVFTANGLYLISIQTAEGVALRNLNVINK